MPESFPELNRIWLVLDSDHGDPSHGPAAALAVGLSPLVERVSFTSAIDLLDDGAEPDLILLCRKPDRRAQRLLAQIKDNRPGIPVYLISHWEDADEMGRWMSLSVMEAVRPSSEPQASGPANPYQLTSREIDVLRLMTQGLIKKEIGEQLSISYHTIVHHERSIYEKLNVHTRSAAVAKALMEKLC